MNTPLSKKWLAFIDFIIVSINLTFAIGVGHLVVNAWGIVDLEVETLLVAFWFVAISSPLIIAITLFRWETKIPTPITWLQLAFGLTAITTWSYSLIHLIRYFVDEAFRTNVIAAVLCICVAPVTAFALYASYKAYRNHFDA